MNPRRFGDESTNKVRRFFPGGRAGCQTNKARSCENELTGRFFRRLLLRRHTMFPRVKSGERDIAG